MAIIKDITKARNRYYGKTKHYPEELLLQSTDVLDEIKLEYTSMKVSWRYKDQVCGVPYRVDPSIQCKFEFTGTQPRWDEDD